MFLQFDSTTPVFTQYDTPLIDSYFPRRHFWVPYSVRRFRSSLVINRTTFFLTDPLLTLPWESYLRVLSNETDNLTLKNLVR